MEFTNPLRILIAILLDIRSVSDFNEFIKSDQNYLLFYNLPNVLYPVFANIRSITRSLSLELCGSFSYV